MTARKPKKKPSRPSCAKGVTVYPRKGDFTLITPLVKLTHYRMMAGAGAGNSRRSVAGQGVGITFYNIVEPEHPISFLGVY